MCLCLFGLVSGLLLATVVGVVVCGPVVGSGNGDGGNGPGVKIGALTTKTVQVDCANATEFEAGLKGVAQDWAR